jgi:aminomethyltransferase
MVKECYSNFNKNSYRGPTATAFLEWITPSSLSTLKSYSSTLSVLLNEKGGIIDDLMITKHAHDAFYMVTNAARRDRDLRWIQDKLRDWNSNEGSRGGPVEMQVMDGWGLLALQGPSLFVVL